MALVRQDFSSSLLTAIQLPSYSLFFVLLLVFFVVVVVFLSTSLHFHLLFFREIHLIPLPGCLGAFAAAGRVLTPLPSLAAWSAGSASVGSFEVCMLFHLFLIF